MAGAYSITDNKKTGCTKLLFKLYAAGFLILEIYSGLNPRKDLKNRNACTGYSSLMN